MFKLSPAKKAVSVALLSSSIGLFASINAFAAEAEFIPGETAVNNGDVIVYQGACYQAQNSPGLWEVPSAAATWFWAPVECSGDPVDPVDPVDPPVTGTTWDASKAYNAGEQVIINGVTYEAKWWTQGEDPENLGVWKVVEGSTPPVVCEDGSSAATIEECPVVVPPVVCEDGSSAATIEECPVVVPPIVCEDGSSAATIEDCPVTEAPVDPTGLCSEFNVYPNWTQDGFADGGDIMVYDNIAYEAKYNTTERPGLAEFWIHHVNCDGTNKGEAAYLSMPIPKDPLHLKVAGWPSHLVIASPSTSAPTTAVINVLDRADLLDDTKLTNAFEALILAAESAGTKSIILTSDVLDSINADKGVSIGNVAVKQALTAAVLLTNADISANEIDALSDDVKGWAQAQNLIISAVAPNATFGWSLNLGDFAYADYAGKKSLWNAASKATADLLDSLALYKGAANADFIAFTKASTSTSFTSEQWHNALGYIKQVTDFVDAPAILSSVPSEQAATYFMGSSASERQLRKAAHNNVFAILFDADSSDLENSIALYQSNTIPLYYVEEEVSSTELTNITSLNESLQGASHVMDSEVFLYELAQNVWAPSTIYKWNDFLTGLNSMHNLGVAGDKFWLVDPTADDATNEKYAKVAIAAFLSQSMQETIRYDACDENNWAETKYGAVVNHPNTASCGQLGQKYADYGINPVSGKDHAYSCPRDAKMEVTAVTHAKWYAAPAPIFAAPDTVLQESGVVGADGFAGRWEQNLWCSEIPTTIDESKQAWERDDCKVYVGQQAGSFVWDGSSEASVEGCGWWGRGVIQTTGRQNFGTLNHFIGRSHVDPTTIGATIDGVTVAAAPANPLYAGLDLCSNPQLICSSEENAEIKWIAGLFFWMSSVQAYDNEGGPYAHWNYYDELKAYVDGGMLGTEFVDAVSGIVNRGCPDETCPVSGEVHAIDERRANFKLVLQTLGLDPK